MRLRESTKEAKLGYVWDIRNVLWLFEDYPELKNELISILNYSVENIEPRDGAFLSLRKAARWRIRIRNRLLTAQSSAS